ncbi:MAG: hypothetical protein GTO08_07385, partial [Deltaproteobacteria bacterium]|nr:hypothetical protein [Deltaproteobacteria bacterium]
MRSIHLDRRFHILLVASLFLVCVAILSAEAKSGEKGYLDGKVFLVEKGEKGKSADGKDTYIFRDGKFRSSYFERKYGFETGSYRSTKKGDTITFVVDMRSKSHGTIHLEGTVEVDEIDVRYTWKGKQPKWYQAKSKDPSEHWARSVTTWASEDPGPPGGGSTSNLLDGKTFLVKSGEQGKEAYHHADYLIFRDGTFVSTNCGELTDFRESTYSATTQGDEIRFRAETTSPTHGTMIWDGILRGDVMDATARWIDKRWYWTVDRMYWFRGKL